jgi:hypothetical protein
MHNTLRKDRYNPTQYQEEFASLDVKDNNAYTERLPEIPAVPELPEPIPESVATTWQPNGNHPATQYSIGKDSIDKFSIDKGKESIVDATPSPQQIVDLYNSICKSFPTVRSLSDARKKAINARSKSYSLGDFKTVFENAEASSFLKGSNDRNWSASFDWLIADKNMAKVLEGQYADKPKRYGRKEPVPGWMNKPREMDDDEIAAVRRMLAEDTTTVGNCPELADRAEQLKQRLQGG